MTRKTKAEVSPRPCPLLFTKIDLHHFLDGESKGVRPQKLPDRLIICHTLKLPNSKLIDLLLAAEKARQPGDHFSEITLNTYLSPEQG